MYTSNADDTYLVIPTSNVQSSETELNHVAEWDQRNNLKLNMSKDSGDYFQRQKTQSTKSRSTDVT